MVEWLNATSYVLEILELELEQLHVAVTVSRFRARLYVQI